MEVHYIERVFIPKGHYSKVFTLVRVIIPILFLFRKVIIPKALTRRVIILKGCHSGRSLFRNLEYQILFEYDFRKGQTSRTKTWPFGIRPSEIMTFRNRSDDYYSELKQFGTMILGISTCTPEPQHTSGPDRTSLDKLRENGVGGGTLKTLICQRKGSYLTNYN